MDDENERLAALAAAGDKVLGSDPVLLARQERPGNWALAGGVCALIFTLVFHLAWPITVVSLFVLGWYANDREAQRIRSEHR